MRTVTAALAALGGVASASSLRQAGVPRKSIEAGVLDSTVQRVARGVYALPDAAPWLVHRSSIPLTPLDVVCQSLRCLPPLEALTIAESAVKKGLVQLPALRERFPAAREKSVLRIVARIRPQSGSIIETMARYLLEEAGLTVELQVYVPGMGHLDLSLTACWAWRLMVSPTTAAGQRTGKTGGAGTLPSSGSFQPFA